MGLSLLINIGVETENGEVISIGVGEKVVGLGRGYTCALRDPYPGMKRRGESKVVSATGGSLF